MNALPPPHLHEFPLLEEEPSRSQDAWHAGPRQTLLNGQHFLKVVVLTDVLVDMGCNGCNLGRSGWGDGDSIQVSSVLIHSPRTTQLGVVGVCGLCVLE